MMEDKIVSATGAQTGSFSTTGYVRGQEVLATFKAAAAAATSTTNAIMFAGD